MFWGEKCAEILLGRQEKESNYFLKGRTNHSQFLVIFPRNEGKTLKHQPDILKLQSISISAINRQTYLIIVSENWWSSFKPNSTSIFGFPLIRIRLLAFQSCPKK